MVRQRVSAILWHHSLLRVTVIPDDVSTDGVIIIPSSLDTVHHKGNDKMQTKKDEELAKMVQNENKVSTKHHLAVMDDIIVHSKMSDHYTGLIRLFKVLIQCRLKISPKKCQFFRKYLN